MRAVNELLTSWRQQDQCELHARHVNSEHTNSAHDALTKDPLVLQHALPPRSCMQLRAQLR